MFKRSILLLSLVLAITNRVDGIPNGYISQSGVSNSVFIFDTQTDQFVPGSPAPAGSFPYHEALTPDGSLLFVANFSGNNVTVIETANNTVVGTVSVGTNPIYVAVTPNGEKAFVVNFGSKDVTILNTQAPFATLGLVSVQNDPQMIAFNADGSKAFVPNYNSGSVTVIDALNNVFETNVGVQTRPIHLAVTKSPSGISPAWERVFVANYFSNSVSVINAVSNGVLAIGVAANIGVDPQYIAITPDRTKAYIVNYNDGTVSVMNTDSMLVPNPPFSLSGLGPFYMAIGSNGIGYVPNSGSNDVSIINTNSDSFLGTVSVGNDPEQLAILSDNSKVYVVNKASNFVSVIDVNNGNSVSSITVGNSPTWVVLNPVNSSGIENLQGRQLKNRFLTQTDIINVLTWQSPLVTQDMVSYKIFRNEELTDFAGSVSVTPSVIFEDHGRKKNKVYTYYITSVDSVGALVLQGAIQIGPNGTVLLDLQ